MAKDRYKITAQCENPRCGFTEFVAYRSKIIKTGTGGWPYEISKLVCPGCRMWADIVGIEKEDTGGWAP